MGVGKDFTTWIKDRINKYEFVENEDFKLDLPNLANQKSHGGDRKTKYYSLTLDMAKGMPNVYRLYMLMLIHIADKPFRSHKQHHGSDLAYSLQK